MENIKVGYADVEEEIRQTETQRLIEPASLWPWGNHDTKLLQLLSAAAKAFWLLYDPKEPDTAPTNEQVKDWLTERDVSKNIAQQHGGLPVPLSPVADRKPRWMLVRVAHLPETADVEGVKVPKGTATLMELRNSALRLQLADAATWQKWSAKKEEWYDVDPPPDIAQAVLESAGDWDDLPVLLGIAEAPILRPDGSLHDDAGYDPETRLYHEGRAPRLRVSTLPDQAEARRAVQFLLRPFSEFPFLDGQLDQAVVLAYLFTLALRPLLPLAPLFGISATALGRFEIWSHSVAAPIRWLGFPDPIRSSRRSGCASQTPKRGSSAPSCLYGSTYSGTELSPSRSW